MEQQENLIPLTLQERKYILTQWIKSLKGRYKVIFHVGSNCQFDVIELVHHARAVGADGIAAMDPSFFKLALVRDLVAFLSP